MSKTDVFVIKGEARIGCKILHERDGLGVWDAGSFELTSVSDAEILLMEARGIGF